MPLEPRKRDVEHGRDGDVGAVPDGLHPGDGPSSIWGHFRPGPQEQLGSLLDLWVPLQRHSEGT